MEDGQFREAESEEQKSLPFNFRAPRLQLTQDKSQARIFWQSQGQIIADHKQQMVKSIGKDHRTSLVSETVIHEAFVRLVDPPPRQGAISGSTGGFHPIFGSGIHLGAGGHGGNPRRVPPAPTGTPGRCF